MSRPFRTVSICLRTLALVALMSVVPTPRSCSAQYIVAHRGASHDAPENTLAAFRLAWRQQADAIEGDFYLTKDGEIVCIHDKDTKRTAPRQTVRAVAKSTLRELRQLDVGSWKSSKFRGEKIPTLAEVLALVPEGKRIFVEIKCGPEILPALKPQLEQSGLKPEQIVIICFDAKVIRGARESMPQYKANWLTSYKRRGGRWTPTRAEVLESLKWTQATGLGSKGEAKVVNAEFTQSLRAQDQELHVWTINDAASAKHFAALGVDSITTDKPAGIRKLLESFEAGQ